MIWSPLAGGLLSGKYTRAMESESGARRMAYDYPYVDKERAFDIIDVLTPMAREKDATVAQLALAWLLHQSAVSSVIIGVKKITQLEDNLKSVNIKFSPEELQKLAEVSKLPPEYPGWMLERQGADRRK